MNARRFGTGNGDDFRLHIHLLQHLHGVGAALYLRLYRRRHQHSSTVRWLPHVGERVYAAKV